MRWVKVVFIACIISFGSCKKTSFSNVPFINFVQFKGLEENNLIEAGGQGQVIIRLSFKDGDGNLGYKETDTTQNITLVDNRDGSIVRFQFPEIPKTYNPTAGIQGFYEIAYDAAFLLKRQDSTHLTTDTLSWNISITDQAGNESNISTTADLILY